MKTSYLVVFAAPVPDSDDILVVEEEVFLCVGHAKEGTTKTSSLSGAGRRNYSIAFISKTAYHMHLGPSPFDLAPQTLQYMKLSFLGKSPSLKQRVSLVQHMHMYFEYSNITCTVTQLTNEVKVRPLARHHVVEPLGIACVLCVIHDTTIKHRSQARNTEAW